MSSVNSSLLQKLVTYQSASFVLCVLMLVVGIGYNAWIPYQIVEQVDYLMAKENQSRVVSDVVLDSLNREMRVRQAMWVVATGTSIVCSLLSLTAIKSNLNADPSRRKH